MTEQPVLRAGGVSKHFRVGGSLVSPRRLYAVDDVSLSLGVGEIVAVVGESGSGKSTLARLLARLHEPTSGEVTLAGQPPRRFRSRRALREYRGAVQLVFQDPFSFFSPFYPASHGIMRALKLHRPDVDAKSRKSVAAALLETVGLAPSNEFMRKRPFELSGGQLQRFGFAQALACRPRVVIADEPVSMLDVSIRIAILNLMQQLRQDEGIAFLYITHDIASACYIADRIVVMYGGHIVETGSVEALLERPKHPYTQLLLGTAPDPRAPLVAEVANVQVFEPPRVVDPGPGCRFAGRCPVEIDACTSVTPRLTLLDVEHEAACHVAAGAATATPQNANENC